MVEFVNGIPSEKLRRLQDVQQGIAARLIDYCHRRGLKPFLVAGSALGAWRDKGMIAWDDDIDLGLMREDFDALADALASEPLPGITLQSWHTARHYPFAFYKVRLDGTRIDEKTSLGPEFHQGIFVDVFPFDALPVHPFWRRFQRAVLLLSNLFVLSFSREAARNATSPLMRTLRRMALVVRPVVPIGKLIALREWACRLPPAAKGETCVSFHMYGIRFADRTQVPKAALVPPVMAPFGKGQMPVPADCHRYLSGIFGDYAKRPPVSAQRPAHIRDVDFGDIGD